MSSIEVTIARIVWRGHYVAGLQRDQSASGHVVVFEAIVVSAEDLVPVDVDPDTSVVGGAVGMDNEEVLPSNRSSELAGNMIVGPASVGQYSSEGNGWVFGSLDAGHVRDVGRKSHRASVGSCGTNKKCLCVNFKRANEGDMEYICS